MKIPVLTAADGAAWESDLVLAVEGADLGITVVRRCVDIVELLAVALSGQARVALVADGLRRLDADAVDRLAVAGVVPVGVCARGDVTAEQRLHALGISYVLPADADPKVMASVVGAALSPGADPTGAGRVSRSFGDPAAATSMVVPPAGRDAAAPPPGPVRRGSVVAVWGPAGAPGRTTVAVTLADELARLGCESLLIDADVYGGVVAAVLGLLDESPGLAAACRQAAATRLDSEALAALAWQVSTRFRVLTGIPRAERWPELRAAGMEAVLSAARALADFTVVDCGFCLESDEELSFDTLAPRRNGATLAVLDGADLVLAVGAADPLGLQRLVRGLAELREAEVAAPIWVALNKVRRGVVPGDPAVELAAALDRFAGRSPAALLPFDPDALDAALAVGKTLGEVRSGSPLRRAVVELASALAGVDAPARRRRHAARDKGRTGRG